MERFLRFSLWLILLLPLSVSAQVPSDHTAIQHSDRIFVPTQGALTGDRLPTKKWQFNTFTGITGRYGIINPVHASILSAPVTMQLARPLHKNLYAFAAVTAAPSYFSANQFIHRGASTNHFLHGGARLPSAPGMMSGINHFGWYTAAEMGLMYINDERTFSISGSIRAERSSYPTYIPLTSPPRQVHPQR